MEFTIKDESYQEKRTLAQVFQVTITHKRLAESKTVKDKDWNVFIGKGQDLINKWATLWNQKYSQTTLSSKLKEKVLALDNILNSTLSIDDKIDFNSLKSKYNFQNTSIYLELSEQKKSLRYPSEPMKDSFSRKEIKYAHGVNFKIRYC